MATAPLTPRQRAADLAWGDLLRHGRRCPACRTRGGATCPVSHALYTAWQATRIPGAPPPGGPPYERIPRTGLTDAQIRAEACVHCGTPLGPDAVEAPPQRQRWHGDISFWFPRACPRCRPGPAT
ncbi:hypothetical protein V1J52_16730 [Streptomyces sp. TRM 70351]|uniref:hypothetical protein n=1 Tax=Streptomyces sp. TRM 70351 TaxID=3116552 RepID=UPI002E7B3AC7|nr:hypothetical protein [Streptomyces sp. TRM 70351]MEE1929812.1 hypothetical protein [Streptomyces sp. TRM 70351]